VHRFEPEVFHNVFGGHGEVLSLSPGDRLVTSTVDAHGVDSKMRQVALRPNPLTGPFSVRGAEPGDTLVVHLEKILPNREIGWASNAIAPSLVDPDFARNVPEKEYVEWRVDGRKRRVLLTDAGWSSGTLELPLEPMLGCIGVAPKDGQILSSMTSAEHGGNMDWCGCRQGVSFYLPVFTGGALLYVGDGHAVQGDGEIGGNGVEISMEVELSVDLIKGREIGWPRAEDDRWFYTIGNARPFLQALQHATTEMIRWLARDYNLGFSEASILMSQCVRYEVANIFNPAYTGVCKLEKATLAGIRDSR
jgi:acetamidase/formamidase